MCMLWHQPIRLFIFTISYEVDKVFLLNNNYDITHHQAQHFLSVVRHCYRVYQLSWYNIIVSTISFYVCRFFIFCCRVLWLKFKLNRLPLGAVPNGTCCPSTMCSISASCWLLFCWVSTSPPTLLLLYPVNNP